MYLKSSEGPWAVLPPCTVRHSPTIISPEGDCIATVWTSQTTQNIDSPKELPSEANARLMAAAPDFRTASIEAVASSYINNDTPDGYTLVSVEAILKLNAAIAKSGAAS